MTLCNFILTYFLVCIAYGHPLIQTIQQENGVSLDLIHRDSILSPLHDPSLTQLERFVNSISRSISRTFSTKVFDLGTELFPRPYEYLIKISVGTPPVETLLVADTGSGLTWFQCNPCRKCNPSVPIFTPQKSQSFKLISCKSPFCAFSRKPGNPPNCVGPKQNLCAYQISYADQTSSYGLLSAETLTFRSRAGGLAVQVKNFIFGCGFTNVIENGVSGVIGLGAAPLSIVKQLGIGKFSYCLVPFDKISNVNSRIDFGSRAVVEGPSVVSIPLVHKAPEYLYYVTLKSIMVGNKKLNFVDPEVKPDAPYLGNMLIDSGTTLTFLPRGFYQALEAHLRSTIKGITTPHPNGIVSLCYKTGSSGGSIVFPTITLVFIGGNVELPVSNTFIEGPTGVVCLFMAPTDSEGIFGNIAQANLLVGFDLVNNKVSFKHTDCTKY